MTMKWIKQPHAGDAWGPLGYVELDNGKHVAVEAEDDTQVSGTSRGKKPMIVTWTTVRTLLLARNKYTDDFVYGCADCWYAAPNPRSIFPHRNAHRVTEDVDTTSVAPVEVVPVKRQSVPAAPVERRRQAVATVKNGSAPAASGISDAMDAVRLLVAQAESVPALEQQLAEARERAKTAEAELAEYQNLAKKLLGR